MVDAHAGGLEALGRVGGQAVQRRPRGCGPRSGARAVAEQAQDVLRRARCRVRSSPTRLTIVSGSPRARCGGRARAAAARPRRRAPRRRRGRGSSRRSRRSRPTLRAAAKSSFQACVRTVAPCSRAISAVRSVEPVSTTMISSTTSLRGRPARGRAWPPRRGRSCTARSSRRRPGGRGGRRSTARRSSVGDARAIGGRRVHRLALAAQRRRSRRGCRCDVAGRSGRARAAAFSSAPRRRSGPPSWKRTTPARFSRTGSAGSAASASSATCAVASRTARLVGRRTARVLRGRARRACAARRSGGAGRSDPAVSSASARKPSTSPTASAARARSSRATSGAAVGGVEAGEEVSVRRRATPGWSDVGRALESDACTTRDERPQDAPGPGPIRRASPPMAVTSNHIPVAAPSPADRVAAVPPHRRPPPARPAHLHPRAARAARGRETAEDAQLGLPASEAILDAIEAFVADRDGALERYAWSRVRAALASSA